MCWIEWIFGREILDKLRVKVVVFPARVELEGDKGVRMPDNLLKWIRSVTEGRITDLIFLLVEKQLISPTVTSLGLIRQTKHKGQHYLHKHSVNIRVGYA